MMRKMTTATEQRGRPRANRAEDWNRRPPAEGVVTKDSYSDERLRLARSRRNRQLLAQLNEYCCLKADEVRPRELWAPLT